MSDKKPWADEPTPLCDRWRYVTTTGFECCDLNAARDLERRLRRVNALIGKLRADTDCGDFDKDDLEQRLANIEEVLTP